MKRLSQVCFVLLFFTAQVLWSLHIETIEELPTEDTQKFIRHASTLIEDRDGQLMVCYYHGTFEGTTDQEIYLQTWSPKQKEWSGEGSLAIAAQEKDRWNSDAPVPCWNPALSFSGNNEEIFLFYKAGADTMSWSGMFKKFDREKGNFVHPYDPNGTKSAHHSDDPLGGEMLPAGILGPIKNKPIILKDGTLLCGSSIESFNNWGCWVELLHSDGTWSKSGPVDFPQNLHPLYPDAMYSILQPTVFFMDDSQSKICMLTRSRTSMGDKGPGKGFKLARICQSISEDAGKTWSPIHVIENLPNPNSGIDSVRLHDGRILLAYNNSETDRSPISLALSEDGGKSWAHVLDFDTATYKGESFSYPAVIQTSDQKIHVTYTHLQVTPSGSMYSTIRHAVFCLD